MTKTLDAIFEDGVLKPLGDPGLQEHALVEIEIREKPQPPAARPRRRTFGSAKGLIKIADDFDEPLDLQELNDLDTWSRDMDALAVAIPPEDFIRLDSALAEADKEAKELVRRQMDLG